MERRYSAVNVQFPSPIGDHLIYPFDNLKMIWNSEPLGFRPRLGII